MRDFYVSQREIRPPDGKIPNRVVASFEQALAAASDGDRILLDGEGHFAGNITIVKKKDLQIGSFGMRRALIEAGKTKGITIKDCENISLCGLVLKGAGWRQNHCGGIRIKDCKDVRLFNLDINGFGAYGIQYQNTNTLRIDGCYVYRNGAVGIGADAGKSRDVHIAHCKAHDNAGDHMVHGGHSGSGIIISHTNGAVVEFCEAAGNGWAQRQTNFNGPVGIWCWGNAENIVFRYNIAHHNRTQPGCGDGDGFDIDGGAKHVVFEHCYSYENEAAGFLLCEYGSGMGWYDNDIRDCVSMLDVTRVPGYGSIHLDCPAGSKMRGSKLQRNLLIPSPDAHAVENRNVCEDYTEIAVEGNLVWSENEMFALPPQPQVTAADNILLSYGEAGLVPHKALRLTQPRTLADWPPFWWLEEDKIQKDKWLQRLHFFLQDEREARQTRASESFWFSLLLHGPDLEGSFQQGNCRLAYDSLKPGTVTELKGEGAEVSSYIPLSSTRGRCVIKAYGRMTAAGTAACLFVRERNGAERRVYFGGTVSDYNKAELSFTPADEETLFGVRCEQGADSFFVDRIDVYLGDETEEQEALYLFTEHCICQGNTYVGDKGHVVLENSGSACFVFLQIEKAMRIRFKARGRGGLAFIRAGDSVEYINIAAGKWMPFAITCPKAPCAQIGFAIDRADVTGMEIKDIVIETVL